MLKNSKKKQDLNQIERMKSLCLDNDYTCLGEIYKLFKYDNLRNLVSKIPVGSVKLKSDIVYGKDEITMEEKFLENLSNYIGYVKKTFHINYIEELLIIDITLNSKYSDILYSAKDIHIEENHYYFMNNFKKMFLYNFVQNILYFKKYADAKSSIFKFANEIEKYNFDNEVELNTIESIIKDVIKVRNDNLYDSFTPYCEIKSRDYNFYIVKLEMILDEYFRKYYTLPMTIEENDNYIILDNKDYLILNITSSISDSDKIEITFGIKNNNFKAKKHNITFLKREWEEITTRLKNVNDTDRYEEQYSFVDSSIVFEIWNDEGHQYIDIIFEYDNSGDSLRISLSGNDTKNLYDLINKQIEEQIKIS